MSAPDALHQTFAVAWLAMAFKLLRQWLDADPLHAEEYRAFCELWGDFSSTANTRALAGAMEQRSGRRTLLRRGVLGLLGLAAVGLGWRLFGTSRYEARYVTVIGERRRERLRALPGRRHATAGAV